MNYLKFIQKIGLSNPDNALSQEDIFKDKMSLVLIGSYSFFASFMVAALGKTLSSTMASTSVSLALVAGFVGLIVYCDRLVQIPLLLSKKNRAQFKGIREESKKIVNNFKEQTGFVTDNKEIDPDPIAREHRLNDLNLLLQQFLQEQLLTHRIQPSTMALYQDYAKEIIHHTRSGKYKKAAHTLNYLNCHFTQHYQQPSYCRAVIQSHVPLKALDEVKTESKKSDPPLLSLLPHPLPPTMSLDLQQRVCSLVLKIQTLLDHEHVDAQRDFELKQLFYETLLPALTTYPAMSNFTNHTNHNWVETYDTVSNHPFELILSRAEGFVQQKEKNCEAHYLKTLDAQNRVIKSMTMKM